MWLHLDHRVVHEAKVACDRVFGRRGHHLGEVIWVPGNGARGARRGPAATHQTILIYAAGTDNIWNDRDPCLREPFAPTSLAMHFTRKDEAGRRYRERTLGGRTYRYYADEGRAIGSVWADCPAMVANTPLRRETTGYPTQKPLKLLDRIVRDRSAHPEFVRCDNGPEMTSNALKDWCRFSRTGAAFIEPGSPWENPFVESFNSRVRDELLSVEVFTCLAEAKVMIEDFRQDYNRCRPH